MRTTLTLLIVAACLAVTPGALPPVAAESVANSVPGDNVELDRLLREDQADRTPAAGTSIDWKVVEPRDRARLARVKEFYAQGQLETGNDFLNAALILQHGTSPQDYLLAHELCVVAISKGADGVSLAAASEDRFLMSIGRPQRFGTQYRTDKVGPFRRYLMDGLVTDQLRGLMNVPPLADAKTGEAKWNKAK